MPTLLQVPVGLWLLTQLPAQAQGSVMGADLLSTTFFGLAVLAAVWLMHQLAGVALGDATRAKLVGSLGAMVVVVTLMTGTLLRMKF